MVIIKTKVKISHPENSLISFKWDAWIQKSDSRCQTPKDLVNFHGGICNLSTSYLVNMSHGSDFQVSLVAMMI